MNPIHTARMNIFSLVLVLATCQGGSLDAQEITSPGLEAPGDTGSQISDLPNGIVDPALQSDGGPVSVVGGTFEPDYRYPWVVFFINCHGVLLHPQWILTAAHCVDGQTPAPVWEYWRTDPLTGVKHSGSANVAGPFLPDSVHIHPNHNAFTNSHDIALVRLAHPGFVPSPYIQTVALPETPVPVGTPAVVASIQPHGRPIPEGQVGVFRSPLTEPGTFSFLIPTTDATGSLCPGDSGSGLVSFENERAVVRGITSAVNANSDCVTPAGNETHFMDVFFYRDWILETMRAIEPRFTGTVRLRSEGVPVGGQMILACTNTFGTVSGPLNVPGAAVGANCEPGQTMTVLCAVTGPRATTDPRGRDVRIAITGLRRETNCAPHPPLVEDLPFGPDLASFFGFPASSPDPVGLCVETFTCRIGLRRTLPTHAEDLHDLEITPLQ